MDDKMKAILNEEIPTPFLGVAKDLRKFNFPQIPKDISKEESFFLKSVAIEIKEKADSFIEVLRQNGLTDSQQ